MMTFKKFMESKIQKIIELDNSTQEIDEEWKNILSFTNSAYFNYKKGNYSGFKANITFYKEYHEKPEKLMKLLISNKQKAITKKEVLGFPAGTRGTLQFKTYPHESLNFIGRKTLLSGMFRQASLTVDDKTILAIIKENFILIGDEISKDPLTQCEAIQQSFCSYMEIMEFSEDFKKEIVKFLNKSVELMNSYDDKLIKLRNYGEIKYALSAINPESFAENYCRYINENINEPEVYDFEYYYLAEYLFDFLDQGDL